MLLSLKTTKVDKAEEGAFGPLLNARDKYNAILVSTWAELTELMELANRGLVDLTTKEYSLKDANLALRDLHEGKIQGRAVLIP